MSDVDALKAEVKKLNMQATKLKMDLHDLSEDLPTNWENIPAVAEACFDAFRKLNDARTRMKALEG